MGRHTRWEFALQGSGACVWVRAGILHVWRAPLFVCGPHPGKRGLWTCICLVWCTVKKTAACLCSILNGWLWEHYMTISIQPWPSARKEGKHGHHRKTHADSSPGRNDPRLDSTSAIWKAEGGRHVEDCHSAIDRSAVLTDLEDNRLSQRSPDASWFCSHERSRVWQISA